MKEHAFIYFGDISISLFSLYKKINIPFISNNEYGIIHDKINAEHIVCNKNIPKVHGKDYYKCVEKKQ